MKDWLNMLLKIKRTDRDINLQKQPILISK